MAKAKISATPFRKASLSKLSPEAINLIGTKSIEQFLRTTPGTEITKLSRRDLQLIAREAGNFYNKRVAALERAGYEGSAFREGGPKRVKEVRLKDTEGGKKATSRRQAYKDIMYAREQAFSRIGTPAKAKAFEALQKAEVESGQRTKALPLTDPKKAKRIIDPTSGRQILVDKDINEYNGLPIIEFNAKEFGSAAEEKATGFARFDRFKSAIQGLLETEGALYDSGRAVLAYMQTRKRGMITQEAFTAQMEQYNLAKLKDDPSYDTRFTAGIRELTPEEAYYYGMYKSDTGNPAEYWIQQAEARERTKQMYKQYDDEDDDDDDDDGASGFFGTL